MKWVTCDPGMSSVGSNPVLIFGMTSKKKKKKGKNPHTYGVCPHGASSPNKDSCCLTASQAVLVVNNPPANTGHGGDAGLIPGPRRAPGEGNDNPLQSSCLEGPADRSLVGAVHGVSESRTQGK